MPAGTIEINFGATPTDTATAAVTAQAAILATSHAEAFIMAEPSADHSIDDHKALAIMCGPPICGVPRAADGFDVFLFARGGKFTGRFNLRFAWHD